MAVKRSAKKDSVKRKESPLYLGHDPLGLGDDVDELLELTDSQAAEEFMSRWMETIDPFVKYKKYFTDLEKTGGTSAVNVKLGLIKRYYIRHVVKGDWDEFKFVTIIDHMLISNMFIKDEDFSTVEKLFKGGRCASQLKEKRLRGRKRI